MISGAFSANGFQVSASNALELIAGTQAASAGMTSANIQRAAELVHADLGEIQRTIIEKASAMGQEIAGGLGSIEAIAGAQLAVTAGGMAMAAMQLQAIRGEVSGLRDDLRIFGSEMLRVQNVMAGHLESLVDFADRSYKTQEKILEVLATSRTQEAQQLIRQGWDNLRHGYDDDAFARLLKSLEYDNTVYSAHAELGRIYDKRSDYAKAEDHLRRAERFSRGLDPAVQSFALTQLATFYLVRSRPADCVAVLEEARARREVDAETLLLLSRALASAGNQPAALETIAAAVSKDRRMFVAALGSPELASLQPHLTRMLGELDSSQRAELVYKIESNAGAIKTIGAIVGATVESELLKDGGVLFAAALTVPYLDFPGIEAKLDFWRRRALSCAWDVVREERGTLDKACHRIVELEKPRSAVRASGSLALLLGFAVASLALVLGIIALAIVWEYLDLVLRNQKIHGGYGEPIAIFALGSIGAVQLARFLFGINKAQLDEGSRIRTTQSEEVRIARSELERIRASLAPKIECLRALAPDLAPPGCDVLVESTSSLGKTYRCVPCGAEVRIDGDPHGWRCPRCSTLLVAP